MSYSRVLLLRSVLCEESESSERVAPHAFEVIPHVGDSVGFEVVDPSRSLGMLGHEPCALEKRQMPRHRWPTDWKHLCDLVHGHVLLAEKVENLPPPFVTECLEGISRWLRHRH